MNLVAVASSPGVAVCYPIDCLTSNRWRGQQHSLRAAGVSFGTALRPSSSFFSYKAARPGPRYNVPSDSRFPQLTEKKRSRGALQAVATAGPTTVPDALLFDCDGVLVDTERDGHRVSFNQAFKERGLDVVWDVELYGELLKIGGGKERMTHYFNQTSWPTTAPKDLQARKDMVAELHKRKTTLFMELVETGALPLRPGVARLVDEARARGVKVAVCSTSNEKAVSAIVRVMLGSERAAVMSIFAGDVVPRKKPDPAIYNLAATSLGVNPSRCVVVEDSHIGLTAAKAAGMVCVVTKSGYTADEDFSKADAVYDCIGDAGSERFGLDTLAQLLSSRQLA